MNERKSSPLRNRPAEPFVSVVIPAYNARPLIDVQLEALARQTYGGPMEVLVSDNGSTDGLKDHLAQHPLKDHLDLSCVDASGRRGAAHARNVGATCARGDFVAFCDADDMVHPEWLESLRFSHQAGACR